MDPFLGIKVLAAIFSKALFKLAMLSAMLRTIMSTTPTSDSHHCTCHGHLGKCDTDRIVSIYVAMPKVAKASK